MSLSAVVSGANSLAQASREARACRSPRPKRSAVRASDRIGSTIRRSPPNQAINRTSKPKKPSCR